MIVAMKEVTRARGGIVLNEIYVNTRYITYMTVYDEPTILSQEFLASNGLPSDTSYTKVVLNEGGKTKNLIVLGAPTEITRDQKGILNG